MNLWIDHRIPIARGGWTVAANIVPACAPCNLSKFTMTDVEFLAKLASEPWRKWNPPEHTDIWVAGFGATEMPLAPAVPTVY